jgi:hypothetical membrane protein
MTPAHRQRTTSALALTAAAGLLGVTVVLTGALTPGYDHRYDTVSRLASPGQPFAMVVRSAIVAVGVLVTLTARALRNSAATYHRPLSLFVGVAGAAAVVVGVAPKDPPDVDPTTVSQLHVAASLIGVGALVAAMVYLTWSSPHRIERRHSAASLTLILIAGAAFPFAWGSVIYGLLQRVILLTALAWLVTTARRHSAGNGRGPEGVDVGVEDADQVRPSRSYWSSGASTWSRAWRSSSARSRSRAVPARLTCSSGSSARS